MKSYHQKLVLITGASSGLGASLAREFDRQGAVLALVARRQSHLTELARELDITGLRVRTYVCDLSEVKLIPDLIERIKNDFHQPIDVLVHNAGMSCYGGIDECPFEAVEKIFALNVLSGIRLSQCVLPEMKNRRSGQIIWIGSGSAYRGVPFSAAYSSSKAAAKTFCESLRSEVASFGIQVLLVMPGALETAFHASQPVYSRTLKLRTVGKSQSTDLLARAIMHAALRGKSDLVPGRNAKILKHLSYWFPSLLDRLYGKQMEVIHDH